MRLINKAFIFTSIFLVGFLLAAFVNVIPYSFINFIILSTLFALILLYGFYTLIIKRIEQLNQQLKTKLEKEIDAQPFDSKGKDEITDLAAKINQLESLSFPAQTNENEALLAKITTLEKTNKHLHDELRQVQSPISSKHAAKDTVIKLAHYDALTTLPNQIVFNEMLNKALNHAKRRRKICAILIIDLDRFKDVNATLGRNAGDQVIKSIATRFAKTLRSEDILARLEADEFIVLLNDIGKPKFASAVAEKLLQACAEPLQINDQTLSMSASIGICIFPNEASSIEDLLTNADNALVKAKKSGATYQFYSQAMDTEAREFIELENALRKAILNDELALYYQPKLHIKNGKINGVEALVRWTHPQLGTIDPAQLISLSEETGMSIKIGEWAIREACKTNKYWQDEGYEHISVAVNLSPKQFHHPEIANVIDSILKETSLNPSYLELEINEATVIDDIEAANVIMKKIKATGVQLSIDHFGTGYTSISHLKQFPISSVKIDKSFIKGLPYNPNDIAITNAFIALIHNLGLEVIAAGVETAEQVEYLAAQNCDMVQGYFLSHPLPKQKIVSQFAKLSDEINI